VIFYIGFFLSPLTPWNDAIVNQVPSAFLAGLLVGPDNPASYKAWYVSCYVASNLLGLLLMLVNAGELRARWRRLVQLSRNHRWKFVGAATFDVFTFLLLYFMGSLVLSWWAGS
jgi:hypothetical protein